MFGKINIAYSCFTWCICTYFEEHILKKVAIADLEAYNPASINMINAWQAEVLTIESSLLHFKVSVWNSGIYKKIYKNQSNKYIFWLSRWNKNHFTFVISFSTFDLSIVIWTSLDIACVEKKLNNNQLTILN